MMSLLQSEPSQPETPPQSALSSQALWVFLHTLLALGTWFALMLIGYALNPPGISQWAILLLSMAAPFAVGIIVTTIRKNEMATAVWLIGVIWILVFSLYLLDLPTGAGHCFQCSATEKLTRSFLSLPSPSGLVDDDSPFLATWPAAALVGYSMGAWIGMRRRD